MEAPGRNLKAPLLFCLNIHSHRGPLFISWNKDSKLRKNVGLGLQQNDSLVRFGYFCTNPEEGQAVGMVQAKKLFVDAFFFFFLIHANIRLFWGPAKYISYVGHQGICSAAVGVVQQNSLKNNLTSRKCTGLSM